MEGITMEMLPEPHRRIAEVVGIEAMLKLCEVYGGATLYIPGIASVSTARRDQEICKMYRLGLDVRDIAKRYHVTMKTVRNVVAAGRRAGKNGSA